MDFQEQIIFMLSHAFDHSEAAELEAKLQDFTVIALIKRKFQHGRYLDCLPLGVPGGVTAKHLMKRRRYKAPEVVTKFGEAMSPKVLVDFIAGEFEELTRKRGTCFAVEYNSRI